MGTTKYFLGLEITRSYEGIYVNQWKYILDLIDDVGFIEAKAATTPIPQGLLLTGDEGEFLAYPIQYCRLIGRLLYLNFMRTEISFSYDSIKSFCATSL